MDLVVYSNQKFGQGGEGVKKPENFADVLYAWPLREGGAERRRDTESKPKIMSSAHSLEPTFRGDFL